MRSFLAVGVLLALECVWAPAFAQTPTNTPSPDPSPTATSTPGGHFQCYELHPGTFDTVSGVSLVDQFGSSMVEVSGPKRLCNPADKNDEDQTAPSLEGHLTAYQIRQTSPPFQPIPEVYVFNQFGLIVVDLLRPDSLLVPTAKSAAPSPPPLNDPALDHYKCYRVHGAPVRASGVKIDDQFGTIQVDIKRPVRLCAPASKNGEDPTAPMHAPHLMCYQVRIASGTPRAQIPSQVYTTDQFGTRSTAVFGARELCVASTKLAPTDPKPPLGNDFLRYPITLPNGVVAPKMVTLKDQFVPGGETVTMDQGIDQYLMTPVTKRKEKPKNPKTHLVCFKIAKRQDVRRRVQVINQFNGGKRQTLMVTENTEAILCLPTLKGRTGAVPTDRNHYKCYPASGDPLPDKVPLSDQFIALRNLTEAQRTWQLSNPTLFCNATAKTVNGKETPLTNKDPIKHLTCYAAANTAVSDLGVAKGITNQFVNDRLMSFPRNSRPIDLCVGSLKVEDIALPTPTPLPTP